MKKISIITPCFNEELNVELLYNRVKDQFEKLEDYSYEHIFIDNASEDRTVEILKDIASKDNNVKIIVNSRNFGWIRSSQHGLLQGSGDATMFMVADLQDPPELIPEFIEKWQQGNELVIGVKNESAESPLMFMIRKSYYSIVARLSETKLEKTSMASVFMTKRLLIFLKQFQTHTLICADC